MHTKLAGQLFAAAVLPLMLLACGGGEQTECDPSVIVCTLPQGSTSPGTPAVPTTISLAPSALTVGNCTTRIPFLFSGGVGPYTIFTSDNFNVPVSSPLVLDDTRSYFFADVRYASFAGMSDPVTATLTVLDSQSRTAVARVATPARTDPCPANPVLNVFPESANFRLTEIRGFAITGGPGGSALPTVAFADAGVAELIGTSATTVTVRGVSTTDRSTLMTVTTADGQQASVVLRVLPQ